MSARVALMVRRLVVAVLAAALPAACAASDDNGGSPGGVGMNDGSTGGGNDSNGPSPDAVVLGKDAGDATAADSDVADAGGDPDASAGK